MKKALTIISAAVMILTSVSLYILIRQPFHDVPREYSKLVNALKSEVNASYAIKDINGDKKKELFLFRGNSYRLFTIDRGTLTEVQVKDCPLPDENGFFYSGGEFNGGFQDFFIYSLPTDVAELSIAAEYHSTLDLSEDYQNIRAVPHYYSGENEITEDEFYEYIKPFAEVKSLPLDIKTVETERDFDTPSISYPEYKAVQNDAYKYAKLYPKSENIDPKYLVGMLSKTSSPPTAYSVADINADGVPELLFSQSVGKYISSIWTLQNGTPVMVSSYGFDAARGTGSWGGISKDGTILQGTIGSFMYGDEIKCVLKPRDTKLTELVRYRYDVKELDGIEYVFYCKIEGGKAFYLTRFQFDVLNERHDDPEDNMKIDWIPIL